MPCSSSALAPARTKAKPSVEPTAISAVSSGVPRKPELVTLTKVVPSGRAVKVHSIGVG